MANAVGAEIESVDPDRFHRTVRSNHNSNIWLPILSATLFLIADRISCSSLVTRLFILYASEAKVCCNHRSYNPRVHYGDAARFLDSSFFVGMYYVWIKAANVKLEMSIHFTGDRCSFITGNLFQKTSDKVEASQDCKLASTTIKVLSLQRVNKHPKEVKSSVYSLQRVGYWKSNC